MSTIRVGNIGPLTGNTSVIADPGGAGGMSLVSMGAVTASGTSVDFTGIPSWARRITLLADNISVNATTDPLIQIGFGGSIDSASNYTSYSGYFGSTTVSVGASDTGFRFRWGGVNATTYVCYATLCLIGNNIWIFDGSFIDTTSTSYLNRLSGRKTLSGTLDRVRFTTVSGTAAYDSGTLNVMYE